MKKLAIMGRGTAGCLAVSHFNKWSNFEIDWYFDPNIKTQSVGEGSLLDLPLNLKEYMGFSYSDLSNIDSTIKLGIDKHNWSKGENFKENFDFGNVALHFNAVKLQNFIFEKNKNYVNIIEKNILNYDDIDADHIIDCGGSPKNYDQYHKSEYIPVNSVFVTQCFWDNPTFNHTLTIARPHGWVFGIPLQNRCSIGYLYNKDISSIIDIEDDVNEVFKQFNLIPSKDTSQLSFNNYYRKINHYDRISYCGNSSFFLEPLEATSIAFMTNILRHTYDYLYDNIDLNLANEHYIMNIREIENIIMLHYFSGSIFKSKFWDYAKELGEKNINTLKYNKRFLYFYENCKSNNFNMIDEQYGTWDFNIFKTNIDKLNLQEKLDKFLYNE